MNRQKIFQFKTLIFTMLAFALVIQCALPAYAASKSDVQKFLDRRLSVCWVEGLVLDDLVMGARGKMTFLYVDSRMGSAIQKQGTSGTRDGMPDDMAKHIYAYTGKFGDRKGSVMFAMSIEAYKPWDFDTSMISVAGYSPAKEDIITAVTGDTTYEIEPGVNVLPSGYSGMLSFYVPASMIKPGQEVNVGYGEYSTAWKVPGKNE